MPAERHALIASTLLVAVVGFLVLLSPQFTSLRVSLGLPEHLPGARFNPEVGAAEIIAPGEAGFDYLGRIAFTYHAVFTALIYATLVPASRLLPEGARGSALDLACAGALATASGGLLYAYGGGFFWHGVFVSGLALLFSSGLIFLLNFRPRGLVQVNLWVTVLLLLVGGILGGWLGSSFMEHRGEFLEAVSAARFNPDLAEENVFWRALTGHEHAMVALALTAVFLVGLSLLEPPKGEWGRGVMYAILVGQVLTAAASFAVWPVGKVAHLVITPAALLLVAATTAASLKARGARNLRLGLVVGNFTLWASVVVPGALVAMSLRKPLVFDPPFRDPAWDWAELAFNVGHWHVLLGAWGVALMFVYLHWPEDLTRSRVARVGLWLAMGGFALAAVTVNLYMLANPPGPYSPNPYDNAYLRLLVEPGLIVMTLGIALGYLTLLARGIGVEVRVGRETRG